MVRRKSLTRRLPCGSWRAAGDGLRSGPGDPDPNGDPDGSHRRVHPDRRTAGSHKVEPRPRWGQRRRLIQPLAAIAVTSTRMPSTANAATPTAARTGQGLAKKRW